jgi:hypothetical protein
MSIEKMFAHHLSTSAKQGWLVGHMHSAKALLHVVLTEARENAERCPEDMPTMDAIENLEAAIKSIDKAAQPLYVAATGGKIER